MVATHAHKAPHVLLINLDRSTDRLARCGALLDKLGVSWERVPGVEGAKLPADYLKQLNPQPSPRGEWFRSLSAGELGCFLSHIKCWQLIADRDLDCAVILEDDFAPYPECTRDTLATLAQSCGQWDVLKLTRVRKNARLIASLPSASPPTGSPPSRLELRFGGKGPEDCTGYMVSRAGAKKLVQQRARLHRPVDFDLKHYWERHLTVLSASPNMFWQVSHEEAASVIGDRTDYRRYPPRQKAAVYLRKHRYHLRFWLANKLGWGRHSVLR